MRNEEKNRNQTEAVPEKAEAAAPGGKRLAGFTLLFIVLTALGLFTVYSQIAGYSLEWCSPPEIVTTT